MRQPNSLRGFGLTASLAAMAMSAAFATQETLPKPPEAAPTPPPPAAVEREGTERIAGSA